MTPGVPAARTRRGGAVAGGVLPQYLTGQSEPGYRPSPGRWVLASS